jgi:membrane carboxypeptidase/penicillin-binding protein PbpC
MNPLPDSRYEIDSELPRTQQMIELTATMGNDVQWYVNGVPVLPQRDGRFFWQLVPGEWELRAIGRNGAVQEKITVE